MDTGSCSQLLLSIETLDQAIEILVQGFEQFALPLLWGSPKRAAVDGAKWEMYEQNLLAEQHIHYGGVSGIGYYHVASTCIAIFPISSRVAPGKEPISSTSSSNMHRSPNPTPYMLTLRGKPRRCSVWRT